MELNLPNTDLPQLEVQPVQPTVYPVDATRCTSIQEMGILFNAIGMAMTEEFAQQNNLTHLLVKEQTNE